jgi:hypothetical protein
MVADFPVFKPLAASSDGATTSGFVQDYIEFAELSPTMFHDPANPNRYLNCKFCSPF